MASGNKEYGKTPSAPTKKLPLASHRAPLHVVDMANEMSAKHHHPKSAPNKSRRLNYP